MLSRINLSELDNDINIKMKVNNIANKKFVSPDISSSLTDNKNKEIKSKIDEYINKLYNIENLYNELESFIIYGSKARGQKIMQNELDKAMQNKTDSEINLEEYQYKYNESEQRYNDFIQQGLNINDKRVADLYFKMQDLIKKIRKEEENINKYDDILLNNPVRIINTQRQNLTYIMGINDQLPNIREFKKYVTKIMNEILKLKNYDDFLNNIYNIDQSKIFEIQNRLKQFITNNSHIINVLENERRYNYRDENEPLISRLDINQIKNQIENANNILNKQYDIFNYPTQQKITPSNIVGGNISKYKYI